MCDCTLSNTWKFANSDKKEMQKIESLLHKNSKKGDSSLVISVQLNSLELCHGHISVILLNSLLCNLAPEEAMLLDYVKSSITLKQLSMILFLWDFSKINSSPISFPDIRYCVKSSIAWSAQFGSFDLEDQWQHFQISMLGFKTWLTSNNL